MTLESPEIWENFGQTMMIFIWLVILIGLVMFFRGTRNSGESKARQELERRRKEAENSTQDSD